MRDEIWDALKQHKKDKFDADRQRFMEQAVQEDDGNWTKHTEWHWSQTINGKRIDYWPSRKKFMVDGKVKRGDVTAAIRSMK